MPSTASSPATMADTPPPATLAGRSLFLDFDGTLVNLAPTPDAVCVGPSLHRRLVALADRLPGRVAIVSGRSIAQLQALLGDLVACLPVAGSHGAEIALPDAAHAAATLPAPLVAAIDDLVTFADHHGLLIERKTMGAALHYRQTPQAEGEAVAAAAAIAARHGVTLQRGKMMVEVRADGDKGRAVAALLSTAAMAGTVPLVFGDDVTDEDGFVAAAAAGGAGVLIGAARPTAARYRLESVDALHAWIDAALEKAS